MNSDVAVFTVIAKNYLPQARVLMRSVAEHHPGWRRVVILVDEVDGYFDPKAEDFEIVLSRNLPIPQSRWFHFKYTILELSTAVKPYAFEHLFKTGSFDRILFLDPDIRIYSPLDKAIAVLRSANIVLTPHLTRSLEDDKRPGEIDILRSGAYNLGFIGIARSRETESFLVWWQQKLYDHCLVDLARGLFVDQKWIDLAPGMFEGVSIIRDPGYNVAYWNLGHRVVSRSAAGYEVTGAPLSFFHFSGYDPDHPDRLSRHQNRFKVKDLPPATQQLLVSYHEELLAAGYLTCRKWPYAFDYFQNGIRIPDAGRPIRHESPELVHAIHDPFSDEGFEAFLKVWNSPIQEGRGAPTGISRLAYRIYRTRTDVQSAMPDIFGGHYRRFLEWMLISGKVEHGLGEVFLTTISDAIRTCKEHREALAWPEMPAQDTFSDEVVGETAEAANGDPRLRLTRLAAAIYQSRPELQNYFPDPCGRDSVRFLAWLLTYGKKEHNLSAQNIRPMKEQWSSVVGALSRSMRLRYELILRAMTASVYVRSTLARAPIIRARLRRSPKLTDIEQLGFHAKSVGAGSSPTHELGVNLVGYFHSETGVGQSVRAATEALKAAALPTSLRNVGGSRSGRQQDSASRPMSIEYPYSANLFYVNADQTANVRRSVGDAFYRNRRNIGFWTWELDEFPDRWLGAFSQYQEIWTPSEFCASALRRKAPVPVVRVPYAIAPAPPAGIDRQYFGLAPDQFIFLCAFDVLSVVERKNPIAAIRAFEMAFGCDSRHQLIIKVNHAEMAPQSLRLLRKACSSSAVKLIESTLSREQMNGLIQCADCVVSLHRSEGFGLVIAEAMYFGKPVIVTNYSGNTDFTRVDNSLLVDYRLVPVGRNCEPYNPESLWADANVEQAASHMRRVAESADVCAWFSNAGREFVRSELSPEAVGRTMRRRLNASLSAEGNGLSHAAVVGQSASKPLWD